VVESEPAQPRGPGLSQRAESGAQLMTELRAVGVGEDALAAMVADCELTLPWSDPRATGAEALLAVLRGRLPDPELVVTRMALDTVAPTLPVWFGGVPDPAATLAAARSWHAWYRSGPAPLPDAAQDAWVDDRLEYRFSLSVATPTGPRVLRAPTFGGGRADWHVVDADPVATTLGAGDPPPDPPTTATATLLATPLRFAGMPAERYWEFEDGQVNLGSLQVQPHDLARLALVEFAMLYGNDWLVVPLDVPYGSYVSVADLTCTTSFGEQVVVPPADDSRRSGVFRLFATGVAGSTDVLPGLLLPPSAPAVLAGQPVEEVLFLRDEVANLAWAVERTVTGPDGAPRNRTDEPRPLPYVPSTDLGADMDYLLENEVPDWWIPMVPVATGYGTMALRKGAMVKDDRPVLPLGVLLKPGQTLTVQDEEIPREGLRARRVPMLARRADGTYVRWTSRQVGVGKGEGASGLAFDSAIRRNPAPPA
jgi:hypothetical protein